MARVRPEGEPPPNCASCDGPLKRLNKSGLCPRCYDREWAAARRRRMGAQEREVYLATMRARTKRTVANETPEQRKDRLAKQKARRLTDAEHRYTQSWLWGVVNPYRRKLISARYSKRQVKVKFRLKSKVEFDPKDGGNLMWGTIVETKRSKCRVYFKGEDKARVGGVLTIWIGYKRLTLVEQAPPAPSPLPI